MLTPPTSCRPQQAGQTLFTALAVIFRGATLPHLDNSDSPFGVCSMVVYGDFIGGGLYLPELDVVIPYRPGDVVMFYSRVTWHAVLPFVGASMFSTESPARLVHVRKSDGLLTLRSSSSTAARRPSLRHRPFQPRQRVEGLLPQGLTSASPSHTTKPCVRVGESAAALVVTADAAPPPPPLPPPLPLPLGLHCSSDLRQLSSLLSPLQMRKKHDKGELHDPSLVESWEPKQKVGSEGWKQVRSFLSLDSATRSAFGLVEGLADIGTPVPPTARARQGPRLHRGVQEGRVRREDREEEENDQDRCVFSLS